MTEHQDELVLVLRELSQEIRALRQAIAKESEPSVNIFTTYFDNYGEYLDTIS